MTTITAVDRDQFAINTAKGLIMDMVRNADSGHTGGPLSSLDFTYTLFKDFLKFDPDDPDWKDRDRFTMGKGHAAIALYPLLSDLGFFPTTDLDGYTRLGSSLGDHPDMKKVKGADFSSGSIGHNLSVSLGMALGLRAKGSLARVICLMGDGEQTEGQIWEAAISAAHFNLENLIGIVDINTVGSDGKTKEVMNTEPLSDKWKSFGWNVIELKDGHNFNLVFEALDAAINGINPGPSVVLANTIAGKGVSFMEGTWQWHLGFLGKKDLEKAYEEIERGLE